MLFGKRKKEKKGKGFIPVERVKDLFSKGFSEVEVIDILRKEGFSPEEVEKAITQALQDEIKKVELPTAEDLKKEEKPEMEKQQPIAQSPQPPTPSQFPQLSPPSPTPQLTIPEEIESEEYEYVTPEEYIEYLIRERMKELNARLMELNLKNKSLEKKIVELHERLEEVWREKGEEYIRILNSLTTIKDEISNLSTRISTFEKTFKEIFPSLIEAIKLLSEIAQKLKKEA